MHCVELCLLNFPCSALSCVFIIFQCNVELCIYDFHMHCVELVFRVSHAVWSCVFNNFYALCGVVSFEFPMQCVKLCLYNFNMHCVEFVFVIFPCFVSSYFYLCSESSNLFEIFLRVVLVSIVSSFSPPIYVSLKMNLFTSFCENL